ncbi:hypothetical protein COU53_03930 [Candidatus Pacearchaeota archaeon CG10_big_fil_rev_8_21_14_0_10_30_48]|nr:MAG: hypothetical protein COU53_03930 [Candidatus Pacearchaeota archaeon CG10_big_fil_rev_8_21_14_0_10_30_48]
MAKKKKSAKNKPLKKVSKTKSAQKQSRKKSEIKSTGKAFVATFFSIVGFVIALIFWNKDKYTMFYAKQGLAVFVFAIIVGIISELFLFIPILGSLISITLQLFVAILWVLSWFYALSGEMTEVPVIGKYVRNI